MHLSQLIIGIVFTLGGLALTIVSFFVGLFLLIYGLPILVIGIVVLLNKKEDVIEPIKKRGGKKKLKN
jgi:hypothetical protein